MKDLILLVLGVGAFPVALDWLGPWFGIPLLLLLLLAVDALWTGLTEDG